MFRPFRSPRALGSAVVAIAMLVAGCHDTPTGPHQGTTHGTGKMLVYANMQQTSATTLVIQVTGPGIVKSDLTTPDTLTFNIPLSNGVATGTIAVPAGPQRVITAHAFNGVVETHRGSITTDIAEGNNPTVTITLLPLEGDQPITVSVGTTIVIVRPNVATLAIGDTLRMQADVRDQNGNLLTGVLVHWATLNPGRATIDTAGLLMVRDTGNVQIVATYGTVGGSAMITGTPASSQVAYQLTWNGAASAAWENPNNWTPHGVGAARVPTLADSVVIPSGTPNQPVLQGCAPGSVHDLIVQAGATVSSSCGYHIGVYGTADVRGTVTAALDMRPGSHIGGHPGPVYVVGDTVSLSDSATIGYLQVNGTPAKLMLRGHKLTISGGLDVFGAGIMQLHDGDTLTVYGDVNWQGGDHTGFMDGGAVHFRGTNFYGSHYRGTGTNTLYFDKTGSGTQAMYSFDFNSSTPNGIQRLTVSTPDGVNICSNPQIADTAKFVASSTTQAITSCGSYDIRSYGAVVTSPNTSVSVYQWELRDTSGTSLVAGNWSPTYTDLDVAFAKAKPTLAYQALRFFAPNRLLGNTAAAAHVWVEGNGTDLDLVGHKLTVGDFMLFRNFGTLTMTHPSDTVLVNNYVSFEQDTRALEGTKLTAGVMQVGSYMSGNGFNATGTHLVRFTGANPAGHYINGIDYTSRTQAFANLEIAGTTPIDMCAHVSVTGTLTVRAGATFDSNNCGSTQLRVYGDLVTEPGSSVGVYLVEVRDSAGTNHVAGNWSPAYTDFDLAGIPVNPALAYQNLRFFTANKLAGNTHSTGLLWLDGAAVDLDLNGHTMTVGAYLDTRNGATLTMMHAADTLDIADYAAFNANTSAAEDTKLTAGVMRIGSYIYGYGFSASGTHKVVMRGTSSNPHYIQGVDYPSRSYQGFATLVIDSGATVGNYNTPRVKSLFLVRGGAVFNNYNSSNSPIRIDSDLVVEPSGTVSNYEVQLFNAIGTTHVQGAFAPTWTSAYTTLPAGALKPGLGYTNVSINAPTTLADSMTVNGTLSVNGAGTNLVLNGHRVHVLGLLDLNTNATVQMTNPADTMEVEGETFWDGGGDHTTKMTAGTVILHGDRFCAGNYYATGTHRTIIDRPSGQVSIECIGSGTAQQVRRLDVKSGTAALNCWLYVTDTLHVFSGATVDNICGGGNLTLGGVLVTDAGSVVSNGPSWPSTNPMTVVFNDSSGTANVSGSYDAANTYFYGLHSRITPGLHYRYLQIANSTTLQPGHLTADAIDIVGNTTLVRMGGSTIETHKVFNFDNQAILQMDQPNDTVLASTQDPAGPMYWDGGVDTLLTSGVIRFYGQRFVGTGFRASGSNRLVLADTIGAPTGSPTTIENTPTFQTLEIAQPRGASIWYNTATVNDTLRLDANTSLSSPAGYTLQMGMNGAGIYSDPTSAITVANVVLYNATGTANVLGGFSPTATYFRSAAPVSNAVNPNLAYKSVQFEQGSYGLSGVTSFSGDLGVTNNAVLTMNAWPLTVAGHADFWSGGTLKMSGLRQEVGFWSDSLVVGDYFRLQGNSGASSATGGTIEVRGSFFENDRDSVFTSGNTNVILNGQNGTSMDFRESGTARGVQTLTVMGSRAVNIYWDMFVFGGMSVTTPVPVRAGGGTERVGGQLSSVSGAPMHFYNLELQDPSGTTAINDSLVVTSVMLFSAPQATIAVTPKLALNYVQLTGQDTVTGGPLTIAGELRPLTNTASITLPSGSSVGSVFTYGYVGFLGGFTSAGDLNVQSGGYAAALSGAPTDFVDFRNIYNQTGATLDNGAARASGAGGFRYKSGFTYMANGTLIGPAPVTHP